MSDIRGIGVDLCSIDRIQKAIEKEHFRERVYTKQEIDYFVARGRQAATSAAAIYAAKEAVSKALGTGFSGGIMPEQIEVTHEVSGVPGIILHGNAAARLDALGACKVHLSLSHEGNNAIAFAVIT